jgi:hypothetical protein
LNHVPSTGIKHWAQAYKANKQATKNNSPIKKALKERTNE